jgi:putative holliday junction resolvase
VRIAAVDIGSVRVGLAVSDELGLMAHPRPCLKGGDPEAVIAQLIEFARVEGVEHFVVGLPRHLNGEVGQAAKRARVFAKNLAARSGCCVSLRDEWLTTVEANRRLQASGTKQRDARGRIDSAAAAVLLQSYLDTGGAGESQGKALTR